MVTLNDVKSVSRSELLRCLDSITGSKTLVWDQSLMAPFNLITDKKLLEEHGVEKMLVLPLKAGLMIKRYTRHIKFIVYGVELAKVVTRCRVPSSSN